MCSRQRRVGSTPWQVTLRRTSGSVLFSTRFSTVVRPINRACCSRAGPPCRRDSGSFGVSRRISTSWCLARIWVSGEERDPTHVEGLSNRERRALFEDLRSACSEYICGGLADWLGSILGERGRVVQDADDEGQQTLLIEYPSFFSTSETEYVQPRVKLECGARSALEPSVVVSVGAYIEEELPELISDVNGIHMIVPERTFLEKLLILHGVYCGYRDESRLPADRHRISRHYYDVAMMSETEVGTNAVADTGLLEDVRRHHLVAFRQAWKRFEEAVPGTIRVVPAERTGQGGGAGLSCHAGHDSGRGPRIRLDHGSAGAVGRAGKSA